MKSEDKTTHVTFRQAQWYVASLRKLWFVASGQVLLHHLCKSSSLYPMDRPWYMVCRLALIGGLWTRHGRWSVSKPWYVTCGQAYIYGLWTSKGRFPVDNGGWWPKEKTWYMTCGKLRYVPKSSSVDKP